MAIMARWLWNAGVGQQSHGRSLGLRRAEPLLELQHFCNLLAHAEQRIQGRHGLLKNHGDVTPPNAAQIAFTQCQQILGRRILRLVGPGRKKSLTGAAGALHQTQQAQGRDGFTRA
jgi:hypothetical protein